MGETGRSNGRRADQKSDLQLSCDVFSHTTEMDYGGGISRREDTDEWHLTRS